MSKVRPVDANEVIKICKRYFKNVEDEASRRGGYTPDLVANSYAQDFVQLGVENLSTLDYAPVVHAHWDVSILQNHLQQGYDKFIHRCTNPKCGSKTISEAENIGWEYCPHCGARMDEKGSR